MPLTVVARIHGCGDNLDEDLSASGLAHVNRLNDNFRVFQLLGRRLQDDALVLGGDFST